MDGIFLQSGKKTANLVLMLAIMCLFIPIVIKGGLFFLLGLGCMAFFARPFMPSLGDTNRFYVYLGIFTTVVGLLISGVL